jgi:phosphatidylglycerophosphate synthase
VTVQTTPIAPANWDAKLAFLLVRPLQQSWVTPNHLTTVRLVTGLAAALVIAVGNPKLGAWLFILSNFLDHTDGELARISGKTSQFGHFYDLASDAAIHILLFVGIGYRLIPSELGGWALWLGLLAGLSVALIFQLRNLMEQRLGKASTHQPNLAGFDAEDVLYLFPLVIWFNGLLPFLVAAAIGSPIFALWVIWQYRTTYGSIGPQD